MPARFTFNGEEVTEQEMFNLLEESQEVMIAAEEAIKKWYKVSDNTASAICYLRTRSRWTSEKEMELVRRDKAGDPISLGKVLSGEF